MWKHNFTVDIKLCVVALWQKSLWSWIFLQFSFQIWMLCNRFYHDLYYGLWQFLLQNEVLWYSPRDSYPTSACCFLLEGKKVATDLTQRIQVWVLLLDWDGVSLSLVVEVLKETYCLQSEELWIHVLAPPGQLWFTCFVILIRKEIGFGLYFLKWTYLLVKGSEAMALEAEILFSKNWNCKLW